MPEDNRFAGLSDAVEDDTSSDADESTAVEYRSDSAGSDADTDADSARSSTDSETETASTDASAATADDTADVADTDTDGDADIDPDDPTAFPFDATEKKTVYVRPETLERVDDARALVDAQLRTDHDVRDLTGREFYDAVFRLAATDTDGLIEEILDARDE
ncbi:hypothetical protein [Natronolimnohabitans innermongolicus]|uniref:Uncharacterized protein n=1 Tax=Natronolimnohabitans innermongolicus JCM 12255 TaxID=1227499 RepID=L9WH62_9EURY|nr:hypothetical protein [Natronolimnohabitans innermongolicus]ELY48571.1 hypothetical protein C493_22096 [Natronolimnohabitans innermongolicus JCM 12255]